MLIVMQQFEPPIRKRSVRCSVEYRGQNVEADMCGFSLPGVWLSARASGAPPDLPYLALPARLYHGVEATICQAERNFSSLSFFIGTLRASMTPFKVEQMMFVKSNQGYLPDEVQKYNAVIAAQQERRSQCLQYVCATGTRGGCRGDGECRNIEELVRSGECMPKVEGMGDVTVR